MNKYILLVMMFSISVAATHQSLQVDLEAGPLMAGEETYLDVYLSGGNLLYAAEFEVQGQGVEFSGDAVTQSGFDGADFQLNFPYAGGWFMEIDFNAQSRAVNQRVLLGRIPLRVLGEATMNLVQPRFKMTPWHDYAVTVNSNIHLVPGCDGCDNCVDNRCLAGTSQYYIPALDYATMRGFLPGEGLSTSNTGNLYTSDAEAPRADYFVNVPAGRYFLWLRGLAEDSDSDTIWYAVDDQFAANPLLIRQNRNEMWGDRTSNMQTGALGGRAVLDLTDGWNKVSFKVREDGFMFERFLITKNGDFRPNDIIKAGDACSGEVDGQNYCQQCAGLEVYDHAAEKWSIDLVDNCGSCSTISEATTNVVCASQCGNGQVERGEQCDGQAVCDQCELQLPVDYVLVGYGRNNVFNQGCLFDNGEAACLAQNRFCARVAGTDGDGWPNPGHCAAGCSGYNSFAVAAVCEGQRCTVDTDCSTDEFCADGRCTVQVCGNDVREGSEECDLRNGELCASEYGGTCRYCQDDCTLALVTGSYCSDNVVDAEEECDDGNLEDGDGCSSSCVWESHPSCRNVDEKYAKFVDGTFRGCAKGDMNLDASVDIEDYALWLDEYHSSATGGLGDVKTDGRVNIEDYALWLDQYYVR